MPTDFQKAKRRVKLANGNWSKPISYLTSSESVEMTDGSNLQTTINNKVDKVTGKGLSTNDYTDADKIAVSSLGTASTKDVGTANGVAELDSNGKVPSSQLPSYVDDVIEGYYNSSDDRFYEESTFETVIPPEDGKSWVDIPSNKSYRWTGSVYVRVDEGVQLGETSSTAYRGDRGKTAYDHSQATGNPHGTTKSDIGLGNVDNTSDLNKPISTAVQNVLNDKIDKYKTITTATNLNTILESGFYSIPDGCTNIPAMQGGGKATLIVVAHPYGASSGQILQILVNQLNVNSTDKMYYRIGTIGTQTTSFLDWNRVLNLDDNDTITSAITDLQNKIDTRTAKVYSFHINNAESNPSDKVTYLDDAVGMTPAHMNFSTGKFDYGSWGNVWFVKECKPCVLEQNGKVHEYLDPNNCGTDILDSEPYNVMVEFPKIWYKVTPDENDPYSGTVSISSVKIDEGYKDYAYIDYKGNHKEHFYMPAYNGCLINNVIRSLSNRQVSKTLNAQTEINYCRANGSGWHTEDAGEIMLINFLLILMGKSTDMQSVYGQGLHTSGTEAINDGFTTGVHNDKGLFYGTNSGTIANGSYGNAVKVFGIENYWGFQWRRYAGDINYNGTRLIKLCYGNEDGSTSFDYNTNGSGYVDVGATPSGTSGGYISKMKFTHDGMYSQVSSGSSSTYYCDGQWFNNSQVNYALRGGDSNDGLLVGAFYVTLADAASDASWNIGAAPSYK